MKVEAVIIKQITVQKLDKILRILGKSILMLNLMVCG